MYYNFIFVSISILLILELTLRHISNIFTMKNSHNCKKNCLKISKRVYKPKTWDIPFIISLVFQTLRYLLNNFPCPYQVPCHLCSRQVYILCQKFYFNETSMWRFGCAFSAYWEFLLPHLRYLCLFPYLHSLWVGWSFPQALFF